eukprot:4595637-Prymnesium_polylepis.1
MDAREAEEAEPERTQRRRRRRRVREREREREMVRMASEMSSFVVRLYTIDASWTIANDPAC